MTPPAGLELRSAVHDSGEWKGGPSLERLLPLDSPLSVPSGAPIGPRAKTKKRDFMTGLSLRTLGFPEIHGDNRPVKLNLRKGLALLIYLAEARGAVARDVMATLLWPESPRETARARLRRMLHRIELTLGQPVFETDRTSVRWSAA